MTIEIVEESVYACVCEREREKEVRPRCGKMRIKQFLSSKNFQFKSHTSSAKFRAGDPVLDI